MTSNWLFANKLQYFYATDAKYTDMHIDDLAEYIDSVLEEEKSAGDDSYRVQGWMDMGGDLVRVCFSK
jgi:uncharacterized protein YejL (UPF0352 family)